ncbi:MAG: TetR/AcrR family transcriptional regulator [Prolixibacteraceae bacterium]|nr:TetR/AcrR family transcriptional regulator [Prolixibacteraceae bacterium]
MKDKREQILETSLKLFVERGFHNTPTSLIAKEAGVATGTLFHYFKTKEELINSLYLEIKDDMIAVLVNKIDTHDTIKAKLKQVFMNSVFWAFNKPFQQLFFMQYSHSPYIDQITKDQGMQRFSGILEIIEDGKKTEILKNISTALLFEMAQGFINGTIKYFRENQQKLKDQTELENAFSAFWDGIKG